MTNQKLIEKFEQINYSQNKSFNNTKAMQSAMLSSTICNKFNVWCYENYWNYSESHKQYRRRQFKYGSGHYWEYKPFGELFELFIEQEKL